MGAECYHALGACRWRLRAGCVMHASLGELIAVYNCAHGFMRLHCEGCARELLVAFSCKLRGYS